MTGLQRSSLQLYVPVYEHPIFRFLRGTGELKVGPGDGPATSLGELILNIGPEMFPVLVSIYIPEFRSTDPLEALGRRLRIDPPIELSREQVLLAAWEILEGGGELGFGVKGSEVREVIRRELKI
jgi:hypothetical protein